MSSKIGSFDHINSGKFKVPVDLDDLAQLLIDENYGVHRMISAIIRARRNQFIYKKYKSKDDLVTGLEELLNEGLY